MLGDVFHQARQSTACLALAVLLASVSCLPAQDVTSRLPQSTVAFARIENVSQWREEVPRSKLWEALQAPAFQPFIEDLRSQFQADEFAEATGLTLDELERLGGNSIAMALVPAPNAPRLIYVLMIDTTGADAAVTDVLANIDRRFQGWDYQLRSGRFAASQMQFTEYSKPEESPIVVFHRPGVLAISKDLATAQVVSQSVQDVNKSIAAKSSYQYVQQHSQSDAPTIGKVEWYLEPWTYLRSRPEHLPKTVLAVEQGFDAIDAVGGHFNLGRNHTLSEHRTVIHVQRPLKHAAQALAFKPVAIAPPNWIKQGIDSLHAMGVNLPKAFSAYAHWFDAKQGEQGLFDLVIDEIRDDPQGPQVDVRANLIAQLTGPIYSICMPLKSNENHPRPIYAIKTQDQAAVSAAIGGLLQDDPDAKSIQIGTSTGWQFGDLTHGGTQQVLGPDLSGLTFCFYEGHLLASRSGASIRELISLGNAPLLAAKQLAGVNQFAKLRAANQPVISYLLASSSDWLTPQYNFLRNGKWESEATQDMHGLTRLVSTSVRDRVPMLRDAFMKLPPRDAAQHIFGESHGIVSEIDQAGWVAEGTLFAN